MGRLRLGTIFLGRYPFAEHAPLDFLNYGMTGVAEMPEVECELLEFPSPSGPFGAKGVGEAGTAGAVGAVLCAINDALVPLGAGIAQTPCTPARILTAIEQARNE